MRTAASPTKVLTERARVCAGALRFPSARFNDIARGETMSSSRLASAGNRGSGGLSRGPMRVHRRVVPSFTGEPVIRGDLNNDATFVLPPLYAEHGIISMMDVVIQREGKL
jgi:hypothetical protein